MFGISGLYYHGIYIYVVMMASVVGAMIVSTKRKPIFLSAKQDNTFMFLFSVFLTLFIGLRPHHVIFGDSVIYERIYYNYRFGSIDEIFHGDWLFSQMMAVSSRIMSWEMFSLIITFFYIMTVYYACKRLTSNNQGFLMLFFFGAFSFWSYAVNGLRNGMACSIVILAITYLLESRPKVIFFLLYGMLASAIHKSALLPLFAALFAFYNKNLKLIFYFWLFSIIISLVAGSTVSTLLSVLVADERMDSYLSLETKAEYADLFSSTGFRWDFILYSFMPILLGWYIIFKRKIIDWNYYVLLATYIYSNSIWVMVIRATNSNRFAYLSWFIYPIVLGYPLLKLPVFKEKHNRFTAYILIAQFAFTYVMYLIVGY